MYSNVHSLDNKVPSPARCSNSKFLFAWDIIGLRNIVCNYVSSVSFPGIPGVERVFPRQDMGALPPHKHLDAVVEGADPGLGQRALLDDLKRVPGTPT